MVEIFAPARQPGQRCLGWLLGSSPTLPWRAVWVLAPWKLTAQAGTTFELIGVFARSRTSWTGLTVTIRSDGVDCALEKTGLHQAIAVQLKPTLLRRRSGLDCAIEDINSEFLLSYWANFVSKIQKWWKWYWCGMNQPFPCDLLPSSMDRCGLVDQQIRMAIDQAALRLEVARRPYGRHASGCCQGSHTGSSAHLSVLWKKMSCLPRIVVMQPEDDTVKMRLDRRSNHRKYKPYISRIHNFSCPWNINEVLRTFPIQLSTNTIAFACADDMATVWSARFSCHDRSASCGLRSAFWVMKPGVGEWPAANCYIQHRAWMAVHFRLLDWKSDDPSIKPHLGTWTWSMWFTRQHFLQITDSLLSGLRSKNHIWLRTPNWKSMTIDWAISDIASPLIKMGDGTMCGQECIRQWQ